MSKHMNYENKKNICPQCGSKMKEQIPMFIDECDRCLAKKVE